MTAPDTSASPPPRPRIGSLFLIVMFLLGSAALRLGLHASPVLARGAAADAVKPAASETATRKTPEAAADLQPVLDAFRMREERIAEREALIEDRMRALEIAEKAVALQIEELTEAEASLRSTLTLADGAAEADLNLLTGVYENMKPKEAASLFEEMEPSFAAGFLARMKPALAARVMAGLSPSAAYSVSVIMAGRNSSVPIE